MNMQLDVEFEDCLVTFGFKQNNFIKFKLKVEKVQSRSEFVETIVNIKGGRMTAPGCATDYLLYPFRVATLFDIRPVLSHRSP